jgi:hypothetical protein
MQRGCEIHFTIRRGEPECGGRGTETSGFGGYNSQSGWCGGQIFPPASVLPLGLARGALSLRTHRVQLYGLRFGHYARFDFRKRWRRHLYAVQSEHAP